MTFYIRGDVLIRRVWERQTDAIIDVISGDSDADTYKNEPTDKILSRWEKKNEDKNGKHFNKQGNFFLHLLFLLMVLSESKT